MRTLIETQTHPTVTRDARRAARADLRAQISRLERDLAEAVLAGAPIAPRGGHAGPRVLGIAALEAERDAPGGALAAPRAAPAEQPEAQQAARLRLEAMLADPPAHRFERVWLAELGE